MFSVLAFMKLSLFVAWSCCWRCCASLQSPTRHQEGNQGKFGLVSLESMSTLVCMCLSASGGRSAAAPCRIVPPCRASQPRCRWAGRPLWCPSPDPGSGGSIGSHRRCTAELSVPASVSPQVMTVPSNRRDGSQDKAMTSHGCQPRASSKGLLSSSALKGSAQRKLNACTC